MSQQDIQRFNTTPVMSAVTVFNNVVYLPGQVPKNPDLDITGQTQDVLNTIDQLLAQANSDKSRILSAQLFLKDLSKWEKLNNPAVDLNGDVLCPNCLTAKAIS